MPAPAPSGPRALRIAAGLSPSQVGESAGFNASTVLVYERAWERRAAGDMHATLPSFYAAERLADAVPGMRVDDWYRFPSLPPGAQNAAGVASRRQSPSHTYRRPAPNRAAVLPLTNLTETQ